MESDSLESLDQFWEMFKRTGLIKVLLGLAILINVVWVFKAATTRHHQNDFAHYYVSSKLYLAGQQDIYQTDLRPEFEKLGWTDFQEPIFHATNPPALLKLFSAYAIMPPRAAHLAWMLTQILALIFSIWLVYETVKDRLSAEAFYLLVTVFLFLPFVRTHLVYSQVQLQLLLLVLIGFRFLQNGKGPIACLFVVAAALIKLYPIVLLPWFVWRSSKSMLGRLVTGIIAAAALAAGFWATDIGMWKEFSEFARPQIAIWVSNSQCFTLCSLGEHIGAIATGSHDNRMFFQAGLGLGVLLLIAFQLWVTFRKQPACKHALALELAIAILLMLFCGATCWWHYLVFLLFPMAIMATRLKSNLTLMKAAVCVGGLALLMPLTNSTDFASLSTLLVLFAPMFCMIAMTLYLLKTARRI